MRHALLITWLATGVLVAAPHLAAQNDDHPDRPALAASADTNDAYAYYDFGLATLHDDPEKAADGFYWAARLDPSWANAFYARRTALLLTNKRRLVRYWNENKSVLRSKEIRHIDSLYLHALTLNPFLDQGLDQVLFRAIVHQIAADASGDPSVNSSDIEEELNHYIHFGPPSLRAWIAYGEHRFESALSLYAIAIKKANKKDRASLHADRGRIFFQLNKPDSALAELTEALEAMRKVDKKDLVYVYQSKALMEYSIAMVQRRKGDAAAAREALGRALEEDLSYSPAHLQLGYMALEAKDTTTALSEMSLAVQIAGNDPWLRYTYGCTLNATGKYQEAEAQLRKTVELDPVYAPAHFELAKALDGESRNADALAEYRTFLSLASHKDLRRGDAEKHLAVSAAKQ